MKKRIPSRSIFLSSASTFMLDEDGAQVVEYALIIGVVSIGLIVLLSDATAGLPSAVAQWVSRVKDCLTAGTTCA